MRLDSLNLLHWRQFANVEIKFHDRLTILTGPNGAGKTTILNMLSRLLGWSVALLSVPEKDRELIEKELRSLSFPFFDENELPSGSVFLSNGVEIKLGINKSENLQTSYNALENLNGVYITSHRQIVPYTPIKSIPTSVSDARGILNGYTKILKSSLQPMPETVILKAETRPSFKLKEALIALAVFGEGNSIVAPNSDALEIFRGFESVLRLVLPEDIGFEKFYIKMPEVLLVSKSGVYPLEALSGGASAIVDVAWQVFLASNVYDEFVVLFDEPENHLHPSLQRTLLGNFLTAFPTAQFVVSTHSPLMITSVENSSIYVLSRQPDHHYSAELLNFADKAGSAEETLFEVLGVEASTPVWASRRIEEIVHRYEDKIDDISELEGLKAELESVGLGGRLTDILERLVEADRAKNR